MAPISKKMHAVKLLNPGPTCLSPAIEQSNQPTDYSSDSSCTNSTSMMSTTSCLNSCSSPSSPLSIANHSLPDATNSSHDTTSSKGSIPDAEYLYLHRLFVNTLYMYLNFIYPLLYPTYSHFYRRMQLS